MYLVVPSNMMDTSSGGFTCSAARKPLYLGYRGHLGPALEGLHRVGEPERLMLFTREIAAEIAANAPLAVQATERMMRLGLGETLEAVVHHVFLQLLPLFRAEAFREGVRAYLEKRPPRFQGR